jgi:hypothetical protein
VVVRGDVYGGDRQVMGIGVVEPEFQCGAGRFGAVDAYHDMTGEGTTATVGDRAYHHDRAGSMSNHVVGRGRPLGPAGPARSSDDQ